jgi:hypothetical protein
MIARSGPWRIGRGRRPVGVVLALALVAVALLPAAAMAASPRHYVLPANRAIRFLLHGSNGYVISFAEGSARHFAVDVRGGPANTEYEARAARGRSRNEVRGTIGRLVKVDVHFVPHGHPHRLPRYSFCVGPGPTIQPGTVRGTIRFRGERAYTGVVAHSAAAELETLPSQRCHYRGPGHSEDPPRYTATLDADHETGGTGVHFEALRFAPGSRPPGRRAFYGASVYEQLGRIHIVREVRLTTDTSTFLLPNFARAPENAVIEPPAPFTGSATFARTPESTFSWTGDLAVAFPGIDPVPLAGAAFNLDYCAQRDCIEQGSFEEFR